MEIQQSISRSIVFVLFAYLMAFIYIYFSGRWVSFGNGVLVFNSKIFFIELPLFAFISSFFFFPSLNNQIVRNLLPIVPGIILYLLFDAFYNFFGRVATPSDFENLLDILSFSISLAIGLISIYLLIPFSVYLSIKLNTCFSFSQLRVSLITRIILLILFVFTTTTKITKTFQDKYFNYTVWAQEDTVRENGRFNAYIFYAIQELSYSSLLNEYSNDKQDKINIQKTLYPNKIIKHRNVHIIVMESFIDPRLIEELKLPDLLISKQLLKHLNEQKNFSRIVSPIYGGGTAQAEFELLTGIKALGKVNQIEFNTMQGSRINAFIEALSTNSYFSTAMVAPSSEFFNSKRAYKSLGFDQIDFLQENKSLESSDDVIFDGDLFSLNLKFIEQYLKENDKPLFNYVLGMYGHLPFERNLDLRPDVVSPNHPDERLNRIANQFYYRTEALARYLERLIEIDRDAIIFVTSDHLPSVLSKDAHYQLNNKVNIALLINNGKAVDVSDKNLYEIPWFIWKLLTSNSNKQTNSIGITPKIMDELYFTALSESLNH